MSIQPDHVYAYVSDSDLYAALILDDEAMLDGFGRQPLLPTWPTPTMRRDPVGHSADPVISSLETTLPCWRLAAHHLLQPLLDPQAEILPLVYAGAPWVGYHPFPAVDALDEKASSLTRFSNGRVKNIADGRFIRARLAGEIFMIPQKRFTVFVTGLFLQTLADHRLHGLYQYQPVGKLV